MYPPILTNIMQKNVQKYNIIVAIGNYQYNNWNTNI